MLSDHVYVWLLLEILLCGQHRLDSYVVLHKRELHRQKSAGYHRRDLVDVILLNDALLNEFVKIPARVYLF